MPLLHVKWNYFEIFSAFVDVRLKLFLFQRVETCLKLFQNYFRGLLQLVNILQPVQSRWNNFEIISELVGWNNFISDGYMWNQTLK